MLMQEEWRPILDYPDYEVSNLGNVRNSKTGRILKPRIRGRIGTEYYCVALYDKKVRYEKDIHRLVAETFIMNLENKPQVDHIDRNRTNNMVTNLRWATRNENQLNKTCCDRPLFCIYKHGNGFQVQKSINQKLICLGNRKTLEEAIILRDNTFATLRNTSPSNELQ